MNREPHFRQGQKIDDFELDELLGSGQDGEVWRGRRLSLGKRCALKFLHRVDPDKRRRFEREIGILSNLDHAHVVSIHQRGDAWNPTTGETVPYYVMEFVPGQPIKKALAAFPEDQRLSTLCHLFGQVGSALDEIH